MITKDKDHKIQALKTLINELNFFLKTTLDSANLPPRTKNEKDKLIRKIDEIIKEYPELDITSSTNNVGQIQEHKEEEDEEFYDDAESLKNNLVSTKNLEKDENSSSSSNKLNADNISRKDSTSDFQNVGGSIRGYLIRKTLNRNKMDFKSLINPQFGKKFCVIKDRIFSGYDRESSKKPTFSFDLSGYEIRETNDSNNKKETLIELVCPGRLTYCFALTNPTELSAWVHVLKREVIREPNDPKEKNNNRNNLFAKSDNRLNEISMLDAKKENDKSIDVTSKAIKSPKVEENFADNEELYHDIDLQTLHELKKRGEPFDARNIFAGSRPMLNGKQGLDFKFGFGKNDKAYPKVGNNGSIETNRVEDNSQSSFPSTSTYNNEEDEIYDDIIQDIFNQASVLKNTDKDTLRPKNNGNERVNIKGAFNYKDESPTANSNTSTNSSTNPSRKTDPEISNNPKNTTFYDNSVTNNRSNGEIKQGNIESDFESDNLPYDQMFYCLWNCNSGAYDELSLREGDIVLILSKEFERFGWWIGLQVSSQELKDINKVGLIPRDYLVPAYELVDNDSEIKWVAKERK